MQVIFEDNHLLAVYKPHDIPTQGDSSLTTMARAFIKEKYKRPFNVFLEPIHRLDKPTHGIVLFAKTSKALSRLNAQMRHKEIQRFYMATIDGEISPSKGELKHYLVKQSHRTKAYPTFVDEAKEAILSYETVSLNPTNLLIKLDTGRYHQIRAQLSFEGFPIIGDDKYNSDQKGPLLLKHVKMIFAHPTTVEQITLEV